MSGLSAQERARRAVEAMWDEDRASNWIGMQVAQVDEGFAVVTLHVQPHHCNGFGICHGGVTFALADSAFAFACNSRNQRTVAQSNTISYLAPGREGDTLTATAREISVAGRSGIYDVQITRDDGTAIAEFRGLSRRIDGQLFEETREDKR